ncbi:hypothetical protein [Saccharopolyspora taberi]|uniref:Secreted protein n=1 Tax=Saccharopolyspora taberi TaxID=60895 RepID=A0ABN3VHR2_9PSEU
MRRGRRGAFVLVVALVTGALTAPAAAAQGGVLCDLLGLLTSCPAPTTSTSPAPASQPPGREPSREPEPTSSPGSTAEPSPAPPSGSARRPSPATPSDSTPPSDATPQPTPTSLPDPAPRPNPAPQPNPALPSGSAPRPNPAPLPDSAPQPTPTPRPDPAPPSGSAPPSDPAQLPNPATPPGSAPLPNPTSPPNPAPQPNLLPLPVPAPLPVPVPPPVAGGGLPPAEATGTAPGPGRIWTMTGSRLKLSGIRYRGVADQDSGAGPVRTLHFTVDRLEITDLVQRGRLGNGRVVRAAGAPGGVSTVSGPAELYTVQLTGTPEIAGVPLVPITLSPDSLLLPNLDLGLLKLPELSFTGVTTRSTDLSGGTLRIPGATVRLE